MSNYSVPIDADLWTAWFSAYGAWDSTINFWLTATFAVIIAAKNGDTFFRLTKRTLYLYYVMKMSRCILQ